LIGRGRTADVFAWGDGQAIKLYRRDWPAANIAYEAKIGKIVHELGAPAPAVGEIVQVAGRSGLVFERIEGTSIEAALGAQPGQVVRLARLFAVVHHAIHERTGYNLPVWKYRARQQITHAPLSDGERSVALTALANLPDGSALCHGDFHPANVLLAPRGAVVIDWENAAAGDPAADVARSALLLDHAHLHVSGVQRLKLRTGAALFRSLYLRSYMQLSGVRREQIEAWQAPVAAVRLSEGIAAEDAALRALLAQKRDPALE
jgi:aminoglycoside phosphotransferase (APT) family kinase protein